MAPNRSTIAALLLLTLGAAAHEQPAKDADRWGESVDGIRCRLTMKSEYVVGQTISAAVEIKNIADTPQFLVPRLEPLASEHLTIEIHGPNGKFRQISNSTGFSLNAASFKPIGPGEILRRDVIDLRDYFGDLPPGKYSARFRFRSPMPPALLRQPRLATSAWVGETISAPVTFTVETLAKDDLVVHEWGVFTIFNDAKYANVNRKDEWGALPSFFYRQFPKERLRWMPSVWDKPIVYFYAKPTPMKVKVKVTFADGAPVVWWPATSSPVNDPYRPAAKTPRPFRTLVWDAWLGDSIPPLHNNLGPLTKVDDFPLPAKCWLHDARLPSATRLTVTGDQEVAPSVRGTRPSFARLETERFLYYDGLVPAPSYLRCEKIDAKSVVVRNNARFPIGPLFIIDRRVKNRVGFAMIDGKQATKPSTTTSIDLQIVATEDCVKHVRQALLDAGLFAPEADSLLKIWDKQFFHSTGVTAFHFLPTSEYDRMLPLEITPEPRVRPTRVGIALHPHIEIEPDLTETVGKLIRDLGNAQFEKRIVAEKSLGEIGPLAIGMLRAELKKELPLEATRRIQGLLERIDAADWLEKPLVHPK